MLNLIRRTRSSYGRRDFRARKNLAEMSGDELAKHRSLTVGMVFQSFNLLPRMTLEENVELPLRLAEVDHDVRDARVQEALKPVGPAKAEQIVRRIERGRVNGHHGREALATGRNPAADEPDEICKSDTAKK